MKKIEFPNNLTLDLLKNYKIHIYSCHYEDFEDMAWECDGILCSECLLGRNTETTFEEYMGVVHRLIQRDKERGLL